MKQFQNNNRDTDYILGVSLGHNSSAVLISSSGKIICGYEEERITRVKSDSSFPQASIKLCLNSINKKTQININNLNNKPTIHVAIGHWFNTTYLYDNAQRYYKDIENFIVDYLSSSVNYILTDNQQFNVKCYDPNLNHHRLHMLSSREFTKTWITEDQIKKFDHKKTFHLVIDGFGNHEEVISLYESNTMKDFLDSKFSRIWKLSDINYSLGLMYQYVTSSVGMKENEDEYKFLGYESHIDEFISDKNRLNLWKKIWKHYFNNLHKKMKNVNDEKFIIQDNKDSLIDYDKMLHLKEFWHSLSKMTIDDFILNDKKFNDFSDKLNYNRARRSLIGNILQDTLEETVVDLLKNLIGTDLDINLTTSGGVFYNVKLNNYLLNNVKGLFSVVPIAGDQGTAIGACIHILDEIYNVPLKFSDLRIGINRKFLNYAINYNDIILESMLNNIDNNLNKNRINEIVNYAKNHIVEFTVNDTYDESMKNYISDMYSCISKHNIVNYVGSNLEFGPRALCNTTSFALPTENNVMIINELNNRDTVMPMAPVMLEKNLSFFFDKRDYDKVIGSDKFMILTYIYNDEIKYLDEEYSGVMHLVPNIGKYSGRPQVIMNSEDNVVSKLLKLVEEKLEYKCLINTSFNVHGVPIVCTNDDAVYSYLYQVIQKFEKDIEKDIWLFI